MFEFNKRENLDKDEEFPLQDDTEMEPAKSQSSQKSVRSTRGGAQGEAAVVGPSIHINGDLHGEEDLIIEGEVKGTVHLKNNSLTIGTHGKITADVYAHTVFVDGYIEGDIYGSEQISIRKTAQMQGNITAPRVSLEDGARFKGTIEMDPEVSQDIFGKTDTAANKNTVSTAAIGGKQSTSGDSGNSSDSKSQSTPAKNASVNSNVAASGDTAS